MADILNNDEFFMRRAIELAYGGEGHTNPNPLVGAVLVKDGVIIGEGFHREYGNLHAEREALADCERRGNSAEGAVAYVTLEPCAHFGKQPPCCQALVQAKVSKVFVGSRDPNPLVSGKGNSYLRENGIEVVEDFLRSECDVLNPIFFHYITTKLPYVALKYAVTMDGKIATRTGESKWITGEESRFFVQKLRNRYSGILCGINTVLSDDPMLNARIEGAKNPVRIVMDSSLRLPLESKLVKTAREIPVIAVCAEGVGCEGRGAFGSGISCGSSGGIAGSSASDLSTKKASLEEAGVQVLALSQKDGKLDFRALMKKLGEMKIDSVLIEGGGEVNFSALSAGIVNHVYAFVAPKIFGGGGSAKSPVGGEGVERLVEAFRFSLKDVKHFGLDVLLEYEREE